MIALTASIIGGTSIYGGKGSVVWTWVSLVANRVSEVLCKKTELQVWSSRRSHSLIFTRRWRSTAATDRRHPPQPARGSFAGNGQGLGTKSTAVLFN
jgi:hypothetical protein